MDTPERVSTAVGLLKSYPGGFQQVHKIERLIKLFLMENDRFLGPAATLVVPLHARCRQFLPTRIAEVGGELSATFCRAYHEEIIFYLCWCHQNALL